MNMWNQRLLCTLLYEMHAQCLPYLDSLPRENR